MLTRPVLIFVVLAAWTIRQSVSESAFNRSSCRDASEPDLAAMVAQGRNGPRNKWPWLVAMFTKTDNKADEEFFCGGSLISERFVLTAAHCIQNKGNPKPRKPEDVNVYLGKSNLTDDTEANVVLATPDEFIVHTDWNVSDTRWDADIAIVKLSDEVTLSDSIQPVCLWTSEMKPEKANDGGMVVGWGRTENQKLLHSDGPIETMLSVLPISDCTEKFHLRQIISERGLCVKATGRGPCNSDSGGGFFTAQEGKWFLRGITLESRLKVVNQCDVTSPEIFTNVAKFSSWIDQVLDGDDQLECRFFETNRYTCILQNSFTRSDEKIIQVSGSHFGGQTNADVRGFSSRWKSELKFLPIALGHFFPNLEYYEVAESGVEEISRKHFEDLPKLKFLELRASPLKVIPVDAFYDLIILERLFLADNQIEAIDSSTFIHNTKLKMIDLQTNKITSLDSSTFRNNLELEQIKFSSNLITTIGPELLTPLKKLQIVCFNSNKCISKCWYWNFSRSDKEGIKATFARQCP